MLGEASLLRIPESFEHLKFREQLHCVRDPLFSHPFNEALEGRSQLLLHEEGINLPVAYDKDANKRKRKKIDEVAEIKDTLKACDTNSGEKARKNNPRLKAFKKPFKVITLPSDMYTPSSDISKEMSGPLSPFRPEDGDALLKSPSNAPSLAEQMCRNEKQERNRVCARECRLRKKLYLENIEKENKMLKNEIIKYRKELSVYKAKEEAGLLATLNIDAIIEHSFDKLKTALSSAGSAKEVYNNYMVI